MKFNRHLESSGTNMKTLITTLMAATLLAACGDKEPPKPAPAPAPTSAAENKPAEPLVLNASFEVPEKFRAYNDMVVTQTASSKEFNALPEALFQDFKAKWEKAVYSVDSPDWFFVAKTIDPSVGTITNDFKKQEAGEQAKAKVTPDKSSLNLIFGAQGKDSTVLGKPNVQTGVYQVNIEDKGLENRIMQEIKGVNYDYGIEPSYKEPLGILRTNCSRGECQGPLVLKVKIPLDKAKEIEEWREKGPDSMRAYGKVTALKEYGGLRGILQINVEALELGTFQNGKWHSYFFLSPEELQKSRPPKDTKPAVFPGLT